MIVDADDVPPNVVDLESAEAAGGIEMVARFQVLVEADRIIVPAWEFADRLRSICVLAPTFDRSEHLWLVSDARQDALTHSRPSTGTAVPMAHRFVRPGVVPPHATALEAHRAGAEPGYYTAGEAREAVHRHIADVESWLDSMVPRRTVLRIQ